MLERLIIRNFQNIEHDVIELDSYVTCFVGESDCGKSARLRALRWLVTNRPSGDSFTRNGAGYASVVIRVDGSRASRRKGRRHNSYHLDGRTFEAFGQGVPEDIQQFLNLSEVNFQQQHDPPFWLTLSPGEVSRELNQIVNLGSIDASLSFLASELRKAKTTVEVSEGRLKEAREREETLRWVVEASEELAIIEEQEKKVERLRERVESLRNLLKEILAAKRSRTLYKRSSREGEAILKRGETVLATQDKADRLRELYNKIKETGEELCQVKKSVIKQEAELKEDLAGTCPLCGADLTTSPFCVVTCTSAIEPP